MSELIRKKFSAEVLMPEYIAAMQRDGAVTFPISGWSMAPFVAHGRDTVTIVPADVKKLRRGDIILYRRKNGQYVLHRIVGKKGGGASFSTCGDAQTEVEHGVLPESILAKATAVCRRSIRYDEKTALWRFYSCVWRVLRPFRNIAFGLHAALHKKRRKV